MLVWSRTITGRVHWEAINKLVKIHALNSLNIKAWLGLIFLAIAMGLLLFVPGTAQYWPAWICLAVFFGDVTVKPCSRAKFVGMSHGHLTFVACRPIIPWIAFSTPIANCLATSLIYIASKSLIFYVVAQPDSP